MNMPTDKSVFFIFRFFVRLYKSNKKTLSASNLPRTSDKKCKRLRILLELITVRCFNSDLNNYLWQTKTKATMEDVLQFLLVAGILAFGIFKQFNKEKAKNQEKRSPMPVPEYEYEPEFEEVVLFEEPKKQMTVHPKPALPKEGVRSTYVPTTRPKTSKKAETSGKKEFSIQTTEEARRAIIWSEILRRKY